MRIALTGATGFIGRNLTRALEARGDELRILTRFPGGRPGHYAWGPTAAPPNTAALEGCEAVIHMAGEPVAQRWTGAAKQRIRDSRVLGTRHLVESLGALAERPRVLVCASAIGYYGSRGDEILTEDSAPGSDFLAESCVAWEAEARAAEQLGVRVARARIGIVLGKGGGALEKMLPPFKAGLGGRLGHGRQWMSWIHVDDLVRLLLWALEQPGVSGAVNATAPNPVINTEFTRDLAAVLRRPALFPVPAMALKLLYGEMSEVLLGSQRVVPAAAQALGFEFRYPLLRGALENLLS